MNVKEFLSSIKNEKSDFNKRLIRDYFSLLIAQDDKIREKFSVNKKHIAHKIYDKYVAYEIPNLDDFPEYKKLFEEIRKENHLDIAHLNKEDYFRYLRIFMRNSRAKPPILEIIPKNFPKRALMLFKIIALFENSMLTLSKLLNIIKRDYSSEFDLFNQILLKRVAKYYHVIMDESQFIIDLLLIMLSTEGDVSLQEQMLESYCIKVDYYHIIGLDLQNLNLGKLPNSIGKLSHLEELNLIGNSLVSLPESFSSLPNIKKLVFRKN